MSRCFWPAVKSVRFVVILLVLGLVPTAAEPVSAASGDCSQPISTGAGPKATDCLFILRAAVGTATCIPECICAPSGRLPIKATDALICLRSAVGESVALGCPCGSTSDTSTTSTTTTLPGGTTTTTTLHTTTTTLPGGVSCSLDTAACTSSACSCSDTPGADYHLGAAGSATGPVGTQLRVNINAPQSGTLDCGGWTRIYGNTTTGCDVIGCCERQAAQPETTQWSVFEAIDFPCVCPAMPGLFLHNFLIQCQLPPGPVTEIERTTTPCP